MEMRNVFLGCNNVGELKKQGKSLDETIAAKPTAKYDAKFGQFLITPEFFGIYPDISQNDNRWAQFLLPVNRLFG